MAIINHPIMLTLKDAISGQGFLAGITLSGRALMRQEDGKWWMYGVRPGGIAECGETIEETFLRFRNRYREVLFDIAQESSTFKEFRAEVRRFFSEVDAEDEQLWEGALKAIRTTHAPPPEPFTRLPRESPESKPSRIVVARLDKQGRRFVPSDNMNDVYSLPKAA